MRPTISAIPHKVSRHPKNAIKPAITKGAIENPNETKTLRNPLTSPLRFTNQGNKRFLEQLVKTPWPKNLTPKKPTTTTARVIQEGPSIQDINLSAKLK